LLKSRSSAILQERSQHISLFSLKGDPAAIATAPQFIKAFYEGGVLSQTQVLLEEASKFAVPNFYLTWDAAVQFKPNLILTGVTSLSESLAVGQKLRVPVVAGSTVPFFPTDQWAPVASLAKPLPLGLLNSLVHWASFKGLWAFLDEPINTFRAALELPPQTRYHVDAAPMLCLFSDTVHNRLTAMLGHDIATPCPDLLIFVSLSYVFVNRWCLVLEIGRLTCLRSLATAPPTGPKTSLHRCAPFGPYRISSPNTVPHSTGPLFLHRADPRGLFERWSAAHLLGLWPDAAQGRRCTSISSAVAARVWLWQVITTDC
jgi:hypothetical protein